MHFLKLVSNMLIWWWWCTRPCYLDHLLENVMYFGNNGSLSFLFCRYAVLLTVNFTGLKEQRSRSWMNEKQTLKCYCCALHIQIYTVILTLLPIYSNPIRLLVFMPIVFQWGFLSGQTVIYKKSACFSKASFLKIETRVG